MELTKNQVENLVKEPVRSFTMGLGSAKGDNVASDLFRLEVKCESGTVHNLVYKMFPTNHPEQRAYAIEGGIFRRENNFYSTFAPAVESLVRRKSKIIFKNYPTTQSILPIPKFYAGFNDDLNDFVCLQDLRPLGFKMPNKYLGLSYPETSLAIKKLAQFHALSYFYLRMEGESIFERIELLKIFDQMHWAYGVDEEKFEGNKTFFNTIYKNSVDLIKNFGQGEDGHFLAEKMTANNLLETAYNLVVSTTMGTDSKYFPLVILGDFWSNNLLFSYHDDDDDDDGEHKKGEVKDVKFLDFQFARRGNIYEDLNYFVYTSTTPQFRQKYLSKILQEYYESFVRTLTDVNCPLPWGWTRGKFFDEFYENILPSYVFLTFAIPLQLGEDAMEEDVEGNVKENEYSDELLKIMKRSPRAIHRFEDVTREMIQANILLLPRHLDCKMVLESAIQKIFSSSEGHFLFA